MQIQALTSGNQFFVPRCPKELISQRHLLNLLILAHILPDYFRPRGEFPHVYDYTTVPCSTFAMRNRLISMVTTRRGRINAARCKIRVTKNRLAKRTPTRRATGGAQVRGTGVPKVFSYRSSAHVLPPPWFSLKSRVAPMYFRNVRAYLTFIL